MARQLPFVVQPNKKPVLKTIGTEQSGQIEIEVRGYTTVGEKAMVDQSILGEVGTQGFQELLKQIAKAEGKTASEVYDDFSTTPAPEYLEDWAQEFQEAVDVLSVENSKRNIVQATALLISRVDPEWTIEDTMQQHSDLVLELSNLYVEENKRSTDDLISDDASSGGAEGKK